MSVRRFRWHHCGSRHLSGRRFMACALRGEAEIRGTGQWAVMSTCATPSVSLWLSRAAAAVELQRIDGTQCAEGCVLSHELAFVDLAHAVTDAARADAPLRHGVDSWRSRISPDVAATSPGEDS